MAEVTHNLALASAEAKLQRGLITQAEYEHILETNREIAAMEGVLQVRNLDTGSSQTMTLTDIDSIFDTFGTAVEPPPTRLLSTVEEAEEHEASFHSAHEGGLKEGAEADDDLEGLADAGEGGRDHTGDGAATGACETLDDTEAGAEEEEEDSGDDEEASTAVSSAKRKLRQGIITSEEYQQLVAADQRHEVQSERMRQLSRLRQLSMADFELKKLLGRGAFGTVLLVQLKPEVCSTIGLAAATGSSDSSPTSAAGAADTRPAADASIATEAKRQHHFFAVKVLRKLDMTSYTKHRTQLEREIMARVHHPFIATLEFAFQSEEKLYLGMEFFQGGDLFHHIAKARRQRKSGGIGLARARFYAAELVAALAHLHSKAIAYRDLKPSNVMLDSYGHIRLVDFGLCKQQVLSRRKARTFVGTRAYVAPEVIRMSLKYAPPSRSGLRPPGYGHACDWWSLGIILYEMLSGTTPFDAQTPRRTFHNILNVEPAFPHCIKRVARSMLKGLLRKDPRWRLGCESLDGITDSSPSSIMSHDFFMSWKGFDWEMLERKQIAPPWQPSLDGTPLDMTYVDQTFCEAEPTDSPQVPGGLTESERQQHHFDQFTYILRSGESLDDSAKSSGDPTTAD